MTTQYSDINELIKKLRTKQGKAIATVKAVELGLDMGNDLILQAIKYFSSIGNYEMAMRLSNNIPEAEILLLYHEPQVLALLISYKNTNSIRYFNSIKYFNERLIRSLFGAHLQERFIEVSREHIQQATEFEDEKNIIDAKHEYEEAVEFLMLGWAYTEAYHLAITKGLEKLAKEVYINGSRILEEAGRFGAVAELTQMKGDLKGAQIFQTLDNLLNTV